MSSAVLSILLLLRFSFEEVTSGRHAVLLLLLHAHPFALTVTFTAGRLDLMGVLPGVRGNTRVRVEDGQVRIPAYVVVLPASNAPFLGLTLQGGLS